MAWVAIRTLPQHAEQSARLQGDTHTEGRLVALADGAWGPRGWDVELVGSLLRTDAAGVVRCAHEVVDGREAHSWIAAKGGAEAGGPRLLGNVWATSHRVHSAEGHMFASLIMSGALALAQLLIERRSPETSLQGSRHGWGKAQTWARPSGNAVRVGWPLRRSCASHMARLGG